MAFTGIDVISGVALIKGGWVGDRRRWEWEVGNRASFRQTTPGDTSSCSHMPNKPPHQSQTTTENKANV